MQIFLNDITRPRAGARPQLAPGIDARVNACVNAIADDGSKFATARIDEKITYSQAVILPVMAKV